MNNLNSMDIVRGNGILLVPQTAQTIGLPKLVMSDSVSEKLLDNMAVYDKEESQRTESVSSMSSRTRSSNDGFNIKTIFSRSNGKGSLNDGFDAKPVSNGTGGTRSSFDGLDIKSVSSRSGGIRSSNYRIDIKYVSSRSGGARSSNDGFDIKPNLDHCVHDVQTQIKYLRHSSDEANRSNNREAVKRHGYKGSNPSLRLTTDGVHEEHRVRVHKGAGSKDKVIATNHKYLKFTNVRSSKSRAFEVFSNVAKILPLKHSSRDNREWVVFRDYGSVNRIDSKYGGQLNVWTRPNLDVAKEGVENSDKLSTKHSEEVECAGECDLRKNSNKSTVDELDNFCVPNLRLKEISKESVHKQGEFIRFRGVGVSCSRAYNFTRSEELPKLCGRELSIKSDRVSNISKVSLASHLLCRRYVALRGIAHNKSGHQVLKRHTLNVPQKEGYTDPWSGRGLILSLEDEIMARNRLLGIESLRTMHQGMSSTVTQHAVTSAKKSSTKEDKGHTIQQHNLLNKEKYIRSSESKDTMSDLRDYIWSYQGMGRQVLGMKSSLKYASQGKETEKYYPHNKGKLHPIEPGMTSPSEMSGPSDGRERTRSEKARVRIVVRLPRADEEKE